MCTQVCSFSGWRGRIPGRSSVVLKKKCFMLCLQGAHFVQLCCQRNIPLLFLQNITGEEKFFCSYVQNCPVLCGSCVNVERIHEYGVVWDHRMSSEWSSFQILCIANFQMTSLDSCPPLNQGAAWCALSYLTQSQYPSDSKHMPWASLYLSPYS